MVVSDLRTSEVPRKIYRVGLGGTFGHISNEVINPRRGSGTSGHRFGMKSGRDTVQKREVKLTIL